MLRTGRPRKPIAWLGLFALVFFVLWPVLGAPVKATTVSNANSMPQVSRPMPESEERPEERSEETLSKSYGLFRSASNDRPEDLLLTKNYDCRELKGVTGCNICHFKKAEMTGTPGTKGGTSFESRIEGTNVSKAELEEKQIRYLQVPDQQEKPIWRV